MVARMNAKIKNCRDEDFKSTLIMVQSKLAEPEEIEVLEKFIKDKIPDLYKELQSEFVGKDTHLKKILIEFSKKVK